MGMLVLNNCDGVELQNVAYPHGCTAGIRLVGRVTALTMRDCTFSGRNKDDSGNNGIFFVRAQGADVVISMGVHIQHCRFEHSAWEAILLDGQGDWTIGRDVAFDDCRGETSRQKSFKGNYTKE